MSRLLSLSSFAHSLLNLPILDTLAKNPVFSLYIIILKIKKLYKNKKKSGLLAIKPNFCEKITYLRHFLPTNLCPLLKIKVGKSGQSGQKIGQNCKFFSKFYENFTFLWPFAHF